MLQCRICQGSLVHRMKHFRFFWCLCFSLLSCAIYVHSPFSSMIVSFCTVVSLIHVMWWYLFVYRFKTNTRLCLSISDFHPDTWNPAWSVSTILTGLLSFMVSNCLKQTADGDMDWHAAHCQPWPSCGTIVPVLTFSIRWKSVVSFVPQSL